MIGKDERKREHALGSTIATSWLLEGTAEMYDYRNTGTISVRSCELPMKRKHLHGSIFYIKWPQSMGDVWCITAISPSETISHQTYGSEYGYIRVEWSDESILIEMRVKEETPQVFKVLTEAGWKPEIVGEQQFIRCKRDNVPHNRNRWA